MARRRFLDRMGLYKRDGMRKVGRAPHITDKQWREIESPGRGLRLLQRLGLAYSPDRTRRKAFGCRTTD